MSSKYRDCKVFDTKHAVKAITNKTQYLIIKINIKDKNIEIQNKWGF